MNVFQEFWPQMKKHIVQNICFKEQSFLNKITTGCLLNFSFLDVYTHLIANLKCNNTIFERIFISVFWILVFLMLNVHFSVNCKAFPSALAFLIFRESFSYSNHFLLLKSFFSCIPQQNPRASIFSNVF